MKTKPTNLPKLTPASVITPLQAAIRIRFALGKLRGAAQAASLSLTRTCLSNWAVENGQRREAAEAKYNMAQAKLEHIRSVLEAMVGPRQAMLGDGVEAHQALLKQLKAARMEFDLWGVTLNKMPDNAKGKIWHIGDIYPVVEAMHGSNVVRWGTELDVELTDPAQLEVLKGAIAYDMEKLAAGSYYGQNHEDRANKRELSQRYAHLEIENIKTYLEPKHIAERMKAWAVQYDANAIQIRRSYTEYGKWIADRLAEMTQSLGHLQSWAKAFGPGAVSAICKEDVETPNGEFVPRFLVLPFYEKKLANKRKRDGEKSQIKQMVVEVGAYAGELRAQEIKTFESLGMDYGATVNARYKQKSYDQRVAEASEDDDEGYTELNPLERAAEIALHKRNEAKRDQEQ